MEAKELSKCPCFIECKMEGFTMHNRGRREEQLKPFLSKRRNIYFSNSQSNVNCLIMTIT